MKNLENTVENLLQLIERKDLISVKGFKSELGYNTERRTFDTFLQCKAWLRDSPKNSLQFTFGDLWKDDEFEVIKIK